MAPPAVARPVLGIDVGGTKILGRAFDPAAPEVVLASARVATPRGAAAIMASVVAVVERLVADPGVADPAAIGIGIAGLVDRAGRLRFAPNLPGVTELDVGAALAGPGLPVTVENDATCATWAELRAGAARGATDAVLVTLGTGIGGGLVVAGDLVRGRSGFAGEPGHMMVDPDGPSCPCGRRGCWERFASGAGLARLALEAVEAGRAPGLLDRVDGDTTAIRGEHVTAAAAEGDAGAIEVLSAFAWWVAVGVVNLVDVCDPEVVVIGGGLADAGDLLLDPVRGHFADLVLGHGHRPPTRIVAAALGSSAAAVGAGLLAVERRS